MRAPGVYLGLTWQDVHRLGAPDQPDRHLRSNTSTLAAALLTSLSDRNAYVWQINAEGVWKPTLVLLRLNRSATYVRWSPSETKFAVASGARTIAVCSYDDEQNWWVAKHLKVRCAGRPRSCRAGCPAHR